MTRPAPLAALACLAVAVAASAQLPDTAGGPARLFDGGAPALGAGGAPDPSVPPVPAAAEARKAARSAKGPEARSTADLFAFTPEEAEEAAKRFWMESPREKGYVFDRDVPVEIQEQMRQDLSFIRQIQGAGATPLHQKIFGAVDGAAYTDFFESRVSAIGLSGCGNGNAVACVIPFLGPSKMWITQNYIRFSHPQVARLMVVFHEARHTEVMRRFWPHASCPAPFRDGEGRDMRSVWTGAPLAGEPACDKTALGSYGSSTIMLKNIQRRCASCTDKVRMDAGLYADDQLGRITDADAKRQMLDDLR